MIEPMSEDRAVTELSRLPELPSDPLRAARLRTRCRAQLARRARISEPPPHFAKRVLAPVVVLGVCGIYVYSLVSTVLRLTRIF
jgi:hypothetical protein